MEKITLQLPYYEGNIYVGEEVLSERLPKLLEGREGFVVTDSNVYALYSELFERYFKTTPTIVIPAGEVYKNMTTLSQILEGMISSNLHRTARVFVVGGGVVGDIGGLASSLYMRGVSYIQIPTTLLAQVDSSVGGKTAVDFGGVKNSVGAFYQPEEVLVDPTFLKTLPTRELACGLGEIVKYATLDSDIFDSLQKNLDNLDALPFLQSMILPCLRKKVGVVEKDEKESGERKCLNVGHTTGHAIELQSGLSHGESVLYGIEIETAMAMQAGVCEEEYGQQLLQIVQKALCVFSETNPNFGDAEALVKNALLDKKNVSDGKICMAVTQKKGAWTMFTLDSSAYKTGLEERLNKIQKK